MTGEARRSSAAWNCGVALLFLALSFGIDLLFFRHFKAGATFWGNPKPRVLEGSFCAGYAIVIAAAATLFRRQQRPAAARSILVAGCLLSLLLVAMVATLALEDFPNSADEYAYFFQAQTYAAGRLWNPAPAAGLVVAPLYTWVAAGKWIGQYAPGWPALLAAGSLLSISAWLLNALLVIVGSLMLFAMVGRRAGETAALLAAMLFLLCSFTIFNAASLFPHVLTATLGLAIYYCEDRLRQENAGRWALALGAAIGLLGITRTSSAVLVAMPLAAGLLWNRASLRAVVLVGLGGLPFLLLLLGYQWVITGHPLEPVYYIGGRTSDHLYFDGKSMRVGTALLFGKFAELSQWVSPLIVPVWVGALALKAHRRQLTGADAVLVLAAAMFCFYPFEPGNRYGPRYYYDFFPLLIFTVFTAAPLLTPRVRLWLSGATVLSVLYSLALIPFLGAEYHRMIVERRGLYRTIEKAGLRSAVVCVTGTPLGTLPMNVYDVARNGIDDRRAVLITYCDQPSVAILHAAYPDRQIWYYVPDRRQNKSYLIPPGAPAPPLDVRRSRLRPDPHGHDHPSA